MIDLQRRAARSSLDIPFLASLGLLIVCGLVVVFSATRDLSRIGVKGFNFLNRRIRIGRLQTVQHPASRISWIIASAAVLVCLFDWALINRVDPLAPAIYQMGLERTAQVGTDFQVGVAPVSTVAAL